MGRKKYLVGLDEGTTGCKTCIYDTEGDLIAYDYREYGCHYPRNGWVEQYAEELLPQLFGSVKAAVEKSKVDPKDILAIGLSSQGGVIGMVDKDDKLIRPFIGWQDLRGQEGGREYFLGKISQPDVYRISGDPVGPYFSNTKLAWLRMNEPENWARTKIFCTQQDYFLKQFGADGYYTDMSSASREGMMDIDRGTWSEEIHHALDIRLDQRAEIVSEPGRVVGHIKKDVSEATGLAVGTAVCVGAHDQNCCTFGAGGIEDGTAVLVLGTMASCYIVSDKSIRDPLRQLVVKRNQGVGNYTIEAYSTTAGSAFRWYRDTFGDYEKYVAKQTGADSYDLIDEQIENTPIGSNGVIFLPYLQGAAGVRSNSNARGTFIGMTLGTKKADMARAVMEGICYEIKDIMNAEEAAGISLQAIRLTGGAAKSPVWCQMMADIFQHPIEILQTTETGCLGAALYAGIGVGVYKDCRDAGKIVKVTRTYEPDPANFEAYSMNFDQFIKVYESLNGTIF